MTYTKCGQLQRILLGLVLILSLSGCAATLTAPTDVEDPAPVWVLDHGRHNSLVVAPSEDLVMRYALGEWAWYADHQTGLIQALSALLWPTTSALGQAQLIGLDPGCWQAQVGSEIRSVMTFAAEREAVAELVDKLTVQFDQSAVPPAYRPDLNLYFVPGPQPYHLLFNSNHQVVDWLESMGFAVRGVVAFGQLRPSDPALRRIPERRNQSSESASSSACSASIHSSSN